MRAAAHDGRSELDEAASKLSPNGLPLITSATQLLT
jgi:hypothetical protein